MAESTQDTIRELRELVYAYARQETVEPLKGIGRYAGFGVASAFLSGFGAIFIALGLLRLIQDETGMHLTGNWSWVPYLAVVAASIFVAILAWVIGTRKNK